MRVKRLRSFSSGASGRGCGRAFIVRVGIVLYRCFVRAHIVSGVVPVFMRPGVWALCSWACSGWSLCRSWASCSRRRAAAAGSGAGADRLKESTIKPGPAALVLRAWFRSIWFSLSSFRFTFRFCRWPSSRRSERRLLSSILHFPFSRRPPVKRFFALRVCAHS